ncbi:MAG TPA: alpha/beta fold hydrolase [Candidatus Dormibacteraeota bacterium]|nr:alpha/beta fold hydrolase [Candidatus Dormibacteraeota bacterium]
MLGDLGAEFLGLVRGMVEPIASLPRAAHGIAKSMLRTGPPEWVEEPLPPGLIVPVPGRGDMFCRDSHPQGGGERGTLLLLHGWMFASDANWWPLFPPLRAAGWRVIAVDARGHGRGPRPERRFRIADCADDVAALLRVLDVGPTVVVGYSMGGAVAQELARRHPDLLEGMVLIAAAAQWRTAPQLRALWTAMGALQLGLRLAPRQTWSATVRALYGGSPPSWFAGELARGAPWDIADAGREIGRFDSRRWLSSVRVPAAVVATAHDVLVPISLQRALAGQLNAPLIGVDAGHLAPLTQPDALLVALAEALEAVTPESAGRVRAAVVRDPGEVLEGAPLRAGASGSLVAEVQRLLCLVGDSPGQVDGVFGPATTAAVRRFQRAHRLTVDGVVDAPTWTALRQTHVADRSSRSRRRSDPVDRRPA